MDKDSFFTERTLQWLSLWPETAQWGGEQQGFRGEQTTVQILALPLRSYGFLGKNFNFLNLSFVICKFRIK